MRTSRLACVLVSIALMLLAVSAGSTLAEGVRENRLFVSEFAAFVQNRLGDEPQIRKKLDAFIMENKDKVKEGFGKHPELVPRMYEIAGLKRMNCIQGRYYGEFTDKLNNEERLLFHNTARKLDWWVMMVTVEEADRLKVYSPSPPLSFRPLTDVPYYIAISLRTDINPYLGMYLSEEDMLGLSFDRLPCE